MTAVYNSVSFSSQVVDAFFSWYQYNSDHFATCLTKHFGKALSPFRHRATRRNLASTRRRHVSSTLSFWRPKRLTGDSCVVLMAHAMLLGQITVSERNTDRNQ